MFGNLVDRKYNSFDRDSAFMLLYVNSFFSVQYADFSRYNTLISLAGNEEICVVCL